MQVVSVGKKDWYKKWFDSPYYHTLYKSRNKEEAHAFIDRLLAVLDVPQEARLLDLACGKGRYARHLASKGYDVTGFDLSGESIWHAKQFEADNLHFYEHDMRVPFKANYFDYIFNFFTSFGYFENPSHHLQTLGNVVLGLRPKGVFVLDFLNAAVIRAKLPAQETKVVDGIEFRIQKFEENGYVVKKIEFEDEGTTYAYQERVRLFSQQDFEELYAATRLNIINVFGDYQLNEFDLNSSPRLILVAQKA